MLPKTPANYRGASYPSGAKSDPVDDDLLLELVHTHTDRLHGWRPDDVLLAPVGQKTDASKFGQVKSCRLAERTPWVVL